MKRNTASWDRMLRALAGLALVACALFAPISPLIRALAFGGGAIYMLGTALAGTCLGYRMMGISTCPIEQKRNLG